MTFFWNAEPAAPGGRLSASVDGKQAVCAELGVDRRATVRFGELAPGEHCVRVALNAKDGELLAKNVYTITAVLPPRPVVGKRLNNFVTEILDVPLVDGDYAFDNPRTGWVFVGFDRPYLSARATLDGGADPVVAYRRGEPSETMRWLEEGRHGITVKGSSGEGRMYVRLVKPLKITARSLGRDAKTTFAANMRYGFDFFRPWLFASFNTFTMGGNWRLRSASGQNAVANAELHARGKLAMAAADVRPSAIELRADLEAMRRKFALAEAYRDGLPLEMDENKINAPAEEMDAFAEAVWEMAADRSRRAMFADICDVPGEPLTNFTAQASAISAALNTGRGHGMLVPEVYLGAKRTVEGRDSQEEKAVAFVESLRSIMPSAPSHTIHLMSGWLTMGSWSSYSSSEVDIKALYDHYIHRLATDPAFHDVGGVGMSTLACDEEVARWTARLVHHYCIEGRTDSLAERLGYSYNPGIVRDGDFFEGFAHWTAHPAAAGTLRHERRRGYGGKKGQCRMGRCTTESGEHFALFTRSASAPNRLVQRVAGLVPGKLYSLVYCTADYDDVCEPGKHPTDGRLAATLDAADIIPELAYEWVVPDPSTAKKRRGQPPHCTTVTSRIVFRATRQDGELAFSDWSGPDCPGGEPGRRRLLNYVSIKPYYVEGDEDLSRLRQMGSSLAPVRPGGVGGQAFWNGHADWFLYPPSFDFRPVPGAVKYRFTVLDDQHLAKTFEADSPTASLASVWGEVPPGFVSVVCEGIGADGASRGTAGMRTRFWRQAPFKGESAYPAAKRPYADAAAMVYDYLYSRPSTRYLAETGEMDFTYSRNAYPAKMGSAVMSAMVQYARRRPERAAEALDIAKKQGEWLLRHSQPKDAPLAFFPPTYAGDKLTAKKYAGECMLMYPVTAANAYLELYDATKDAKWRTAALNIGETFLRLQGEDGTWWLKMREKDGSPIGRNRCFPMNQMLFFEKLYSLTGDSKWRSAADRAFSFVENGPLKTWNWEGQFEDVEPTERFVNLTKHDACSTAMYLLNRYPGDAARLAQARELLRFSEDQFVCWELPCRSDGKGPRYTGKEKLWVQNDYLDWVVPGVTEQYHCYHPIDSSAAKLIRTYLALYRATGSAEDLAKARTLGNVIVNLQDPDGRIPTHWNKKHFHDRDYDWVNCMLAAARALDLLAATVRGERAENVKQERERKDT